MSDVPLDHRAGDLGFCASKGIIGFIIRLVQSVFWSRNKGLAHCFILDGWDQGRRDWRVIQAHSRGVDADGWLSDLTKRGPYKIVPLPAGADRAKLLLFARSQVGQKYGFLTDVSIAINIITPKLLKIDLRGKGTWICSGLLSGALWFAGWVPMCKAADVYQIAPAELYGALAEGTPLTASPFA